MSEPRVAVVTGASRGIGCAIATALAISGHHVVGTATSATGVAAIEAALKPHGNHHGLILDVSKRESLENFFSELETCQLIPMVLVNNAAITRDNLLLRMKDDEWQQVIDTNLTAVFQLSKRFVRAMIKARFGRIITITSVVGAAGNAGQANYAAAKAGVVGFTKSLAQEVANRSITVNAIAPGLIDTDMTRALSDAQRAQLMARVPAGRFGTTDEIASLAVYLASDRAAYITGETIHVNGGMYMA